MSISSLPFLTAVMVAFLSAPVGADAAITAKPVRMGSDGVCHCPGGARYGQMEDFETYPSINACLSEGGRESVLGQGDCSMPSLVPQTGQESMLERIINRAFNTPAQPELSGQADPDGGCLDGHNDLLAKLSTGPVRYSRDGCRVVQGRWVDLYTGKEHVDPSGLELGHLVPWEFAKTHGGDAWDEDERHQFLSDPANLFVVSAEINQEKDASSLLEWLPQAEEQQCTYLLGVSRLIDRYEIALSRYEANDLSALMGDVCRG
jgi:hypothetical protein